MAMNKVKCPRCGRMVAVTHRTVTAKKPYIETIIKPHIASNKTKCLMGGIQYHVIDQEVDDKTLQGRKS